jgi:uncharacterized repeat protein (TIGR03943 family)
VTARRDRSLLLLLTGGFAVWLVLSGTVLNFVRPAMEPYVLAAGIVALLLGVAPEGAGSPDHAHGVGVGWLLVLPVLIGLLVPPSPLGANAVRSRVVTRGAGGTAFPPVAAPERGAVPMSVAEFTTRALRDPRGSLRDVPVRLVGFVSGADGGGYRLARFVIFCCAADAEAIEVAVTGDAVPRARDRWLEVTGVWVPAPATRAFAVPRLRASSVREVKRPGQPYEYTNMWSG